MEVVIITGLSGAGKSQAVNCLEDLGYYCIDNMPPALIKHFISLALTEKSDIEKAAFVVDIRGGEFFDELNGAIEDLQKSSLKYKVIFLGASDEVLIRRFNETRRVHPMTGRAITQATIERERKALEGIRYRADYVIDTSNMKASDLKKEIHDIFTSAGEQDTFVINIMSFGYKKGIPLTADMVFDMRFIPNPYYFRSMKKLTGKSKKVREFVLKHKEAQDFIKALKDMADMMIPLFEEQGKYHLNIAFGCTGGQHRSVVMANEFTRIFKEQGRTVTLEHRDAKK